MNKNETFSIFRFAIALIIVAFHFWHPDFRETLKFLFSGQSYVTFFFVLSGFLTDASQLSRSPSSINYRAFTKKKIVSLAPLYFFVFFICLLIEFKNARFPLGDIVLGVTLTQSWFPAHSLGLNPPAWFISALFSLFLLYPIIFNLFRKLCVCHILLLSVFVFLSTQIAGMVLLGSALNNTVQIIFYSPISHFASFLVGIAAHRTAINKKNVKTVHALTILSISITVVFIIIQYDRVLMNTYSILLGGSFLSPFFATMTAAIYFLPVSLNKNALNFLGFLGSISFPIYLLQVPVFKVVDRFYITMSFGHEHLFPVYLLCLFIISAIWVLLLEKLFRRVFKKPEQPAGNDAPR